MSGIYGTFPGSPLYSTLGVPNGAIADLYSSGVSWKGSIYQSGTSVTTSIRKGVGIVFDQTVDDNGIKKCVIREIDPGSSASEEPSLNIGDTIICVNGKNCYGLSLRTLRAYIPGPADTEVKLGFQSEGGDRVEVTLMRGVSNTGPILESKRGLVTRTGPPSVAGSESTDISAETPAGWDKKLDPKGFVFWVNHEDKMISYTHPGSNQA
eukprot:CAMPEP_0179457972 /NCGR_PEP_ID=MMETSP0799-20121207/41622_1 /TAXON_ID=46947 /ORGANISM="Geminigera cryophila, Strain CCMP2564" /LENGTH=208 /DNA_ID=CAMNT_0021258957 /DNA_START=11 /DNA_END=637 /DNA_ORIENTATION=-